MEQVTDPFESARPIGISPDVRSPSTLGTELSRDLEDRVAKLESGLRSFRGELAQLTTDRNRRTVVVGGIPTRRRAPSGGRTASILADTLQLDFPPSSYQYDYSDTLRPSTSPQSPRTPVGTDPSATIPDLPVPERAADDPFSTPSLPRAALETSAGNGNAASQSQPPQYTFRSLYEMLADERSARRRLESQMRGLRDEIANLHYQVSQSNAQSQRSSYYAPMDPMVGSSRLHALLRDTESSPPGTSQSQQQRQSGGPRDSADQPRVVSRLAAQKAKRAAWQSQ